MKNTFVATALFVVTALSGYGCMDSSSGNHSSQNSRNDEFDPGPEPPHEYQLSGSVSGLFAGNSVILENNGQSLTVAANGQFSFSGTFPQGTQYNIRVAHQPARERCEIANASGTVETVAQDTIVVQCRLNLLLAAVDHNAPANRGLEPYRSDGSAVGTALVKDINTGNDDSISLVTQFGDALYYSETDGDYEAQLWRLDAVSSVAQPVRSDNGKRLLRSRCLFTFKSELYLSAAEEDPAVTSWLPTPLWKISDNGLVAVAALPNPGGDDFNVTTCPVVAGDVMYFFTAGINGGYLLWRSDGSTAGTARVQTAAGLRPASPSGMLAGHSKLYFEEYTSQGSVPWSSDGTDAGTYRLDAHNLGLKTSPEEYAFVTLGDELYFLATSDLTAATALWKSDGTPSGTELVSEAAARSMLAADSRIFYWINTPGGDTLWVTDGNDPAVAVAVPAGFHLEGEAADGSGTWFYGSDATGPLILHVAATLTTASVARLPAGAAHDNVAFTPFAGKVYFSLVTEQLGSELWRSDGSDGGTQIVMDIVAGGGSSRPVVLASTATALYFSANDGVHGRELWRTTDSGAEMLADVNHNTNGGLFPFPYEAPSVTVGEVSYFVADDGIHGYELWRSDGTTEGTRMVKDINAGADTSDINCLTLVGDVVYFYATDKGTAPQYYHQEDYRLWRSQGTPETTVPVSDKIAPGDPALHSHQIFPDSWRCPAAAGGLLYFAGHDGLWRSDGSDAGTVQLSDANTPELAISRADSFISAGDKVFFMATRADTGRELWRSDTGANGFQLVKDLVPGADSGIVGSLVSMGGLVYFNYADPDALSSDPPHRYSLWRSDGSDTGTFALYDAAAAQNTLSSVMTNETLTPAGEFLYFVLRSDDDSYFELWRTKGSGADTHKVTAIDSGGNPGIVLLGGDAHSFYFIQDDVGSGLDLWKTDGSEAGTAMVSKLVGQDTPWYRQQLIGYPETEHGKNHFTIVDNIAYFRVWTALYPQLWRSDGTTDRTSRLDGIELESILNP